MIEYLIAHFIEIAIIVAVISSFAFSLSVLYRIIK